MFNTSIKKNYHLIADIYDQLAPFKNRKAGALSGGMKQKLALCRALIHRPKVLFLDEPTTGVDAVSRKEFWAILKRLKNTGMTIFVSTPYMDEAGLCDRISLIQKGSILSTSTPKELTQAYDLNLLAVKANKMNDARRFLASAPGIMDAYPFGEFLHIVTGNRDITESSVQSLLHQRGFEEVVIKPVSPTIEDVFIHLMQHSQYQPNHVS